MNLRPLFKLLLFTGIVTVALSIFFMAQKFTEKMANESLIGATVDPKKCSFEETRPYYSEYRTVIPPDNKWHKSAYRVTKNKRLQVKVDRSYDFAKTGWLIQEYPKSDQNGILSINDGKVQSINLGTVPKHKFYDKHVYFTIQNSGSISYRYQGEGCLVILVEMQ